MKFLGIFLQSQHDNFTQYMPASYKEWYPIKEIKKQQFDILKPQFGSDLNKLIRKEKT